MEFEQLERYLEEGLAQNKRFFTTSSFQTHSLVLLHQLSRIKPDIPVYFINTGYHFPETIQFRDEVSRRFGLTNVVDLHPSTPKSMQRDAQGNLLFTSDPDYCCHINKTRPVDNLLRQYDIWINGVRSDQSTTRSRMKTEQEAPYQVTRVHPMLDWTNKRIYEYIRAHDLPRHPLESKGYTSSIGCEPCTRKYDPELQEREVRWFGMNKNECGLHTDLIKS